MKKISTIIMALVVVMTMAQCKKNNPTTPDNQNNVVTITLDVKNNNGSRVDVNTTSGTVDFETGDKVYVGSGGKYVGFLTHNGTNFVGNITNPTENQPLQLYFLGNVMPTETLSAGTTEECSVIISDQTEHLPVISCAASNENYVSGLTSYTGHLLNKCALVKFNVTTPSNSPICITGMKNKVTVDFTQNTMTPSIDGNGVIMLPAGSGENVEKWAILLPQEALEAGGYGTVYSEGGNYLGAYSAIPQILENNYLTDGIIVTIDYEVFPVGAVNGLFTINNYGGQVYFSQGNLQYIGSASSPYWKFADNQWDYYGSSTGQNSSSQTVDRDLFGWGTSGYNHGAVAYQPWSTSTNYSHYFAYGSEGYHLNSFATMTADWGYNVITNGGNIENRGWRTLTRGEWYYLFNSRPNAALKWGHGKVNGHNGIILLPDDWTQPEGLGFVSGSSNWGNIYNLTQWSQMEENGAVFLPASGFREGTSVNNVGSYGGYWSSSYYFNYSSNAYFLYFISGYNSPQDYSNRCYGHSVRLVIDA